MFSQDQVGGEIVSSPALEQGRNGRAEFVEKITELQALLHIKWNISHGAEVYGRSTTSSGAAPEPLEIRQQSIRWHRLRPVVGTEVSVRPSVDEKDTPA